MATTDDVLVDRVRSLCAGFGWTEAVSSDAFTLQPTGAATSVYRVQARGGPVRGGTGYTEERTGSLDIEVARLINADYDGTRRALLRDANSLTAACIRDGHETWGEYTVPDTGRASSIAGTPGAGFLTLRLTLPVQYEAYV